MKKRVYYIPIEPLKERYTEQWFKYIPQALSKYNFDVHVIVGEPLNNSVEVGTFLDINSTVHYKAVQLQKISKLFYEGTIKDGDIFFIADLEFWGIESIRYLADLQNIKVGIFGFLHAASYTKEDYMEKCAGYGKYFELGWLRICDIVFVGSNYHRQAIFNRRIKKYCTSKMDRKDLYNKIVVSGNPLFRQAYTNVAYDTTGKRNQIIISNRFDWEKRPNLTLDFAYLIKKKYGDNISIIITTSRPKFKSNKNWLTQYAYNLYKDGIIDYIYEDLSKDDYHTLLKQSKIMISNTIEENFGYCIAEACLFNTYPLIKRDYSHIELVENDDRLLFDDEDEILDKVDKLLKADFDIIHYATKYYKSMNEIMKILMRW
jgi:hypothetical protein